MIETKWLCTFRAVCLRLLGFRSTCIMRIKWKSAKDRKHRAMELTVIHITIMRWLLYRKRNGGHREWMGITGTVALSSLKTLNAPRVSNWLSKSWQRTGGYPGHWWFTWYMDPEPNMISLPEVDRLYITLSKIFLQAHETIFRGKK